MSACSLIYLRHRVRIKKREKNLSKIVATVSISSFERATRQIRLDNSRRIDLPWKPLKKEYCVKNSTRDVEIYYMS